MATTPDKRSGPEVVLTTTAKSKCHRLIPQYQLRNAVENCIETGAGELYQKGDTNEYHLLEGKYAIAFVVEENTVVVITQMHQHVDYHHDDLYQRVDGVAEAGGVSS